MMSAISLGKIFKSQKPKWGLKIRTLKCLKQQNNGFFYIFDSWGKLLKGQNQKSRVIDSFYGVSEITDYYQQNVAVTLIIVMDNHIQGKK